MRLLSALPSFNRWVSKQAVRKPGVQLLIAASLAIGFGAASQAPVIHRKHPQILIETAKGDIKIELFSDQAPRTVENFLRYVDEGFFDDTIFHRVIRNFVVQGGGFTPELELKPVHDAVKIESHRNLPNVRGTVAMARNDERNSATSQFFINLKDNDKLDRKAASVGYTVFGQVIEGMEVVDRISNVQTSRRGYMDDVPILPVFVESIRRIDEE